MNARPASTNKSPARRYLSLIRKRIAAIRQDVPRLTGMGERIAELVLAGGNIFPPPVSEFWPGECSYRAGGLMGIKPADYAPVSGKDVALFALSDPHRPHLAGQEKLKALTKTKAQLFAIGRCEELGPGIPAKRFAGFTGGADAQEGLYGIDGFRPLVPLRPFDLIVRGWIVLGEMVAACTRAGRMPTIWMSIWLEGAAVRNAHFIQHNNHREPWGNEMWHEDMYVPPLPPGYAAGEYLKAIEGLVGVLENQESVLAKAGLWMAQAKKAGRGICSVAVDHSYPPVLAVPKESGYPIDWRNAVSDLRRAVPAELSKGDVALHQGYSPVDLEDVERILDRGLRLILTSPYGRRVGMKEHPNFIWFDLPWRPGDATVDVPGYGVRIMPMSSTAHTLSYFAILCELAERMEWR